MHHAACVVILAGGRGTRISHLAPRVPKPWVRVAGKPFIEWVLRYLAEQGCRRFVISLGHLADVAQAHLDARPTDGLQIDRVVEREPLGTGGALRLAAAACCDAELLIVVNGDSLVLADFSPVWQLLALPAVDGALLGVEVADAARYGRIEADGADRLVRFREKQSGPGVINAGVYFFKRRVLSMLPRTTPLSMEHEGFPALLAGGARLTVNHCRAPFLDMGTPQSLAAADRFIGEHFAAGAHA